MIRRVLTVWGVIRKQHLYELAPAHRQTKMGRLIFQSPGDAPTENRGQRLRVALEMLGPIFIKFGQLLSTRRDLLPDDIADELAQLQDNVPPFASEDAISCIEAAFGGSISDHFSSFDQTPLAAASVAQVHAATLPTGEAVVVKVLRPEIESVIQKDLKLIRALAWTVERLFKEGQRLKPQEVAADYQRTLLNELDLRREAGNASQLRRNFSDSGLVYVPEVHWALNAEKVMVSERIYGIPVTDVEALNQQGVDMKILAERGVEIFFTQVFRDSFFHADMHPGNIFVDATDPLNPSYLAIDCAIVGQLDEHDLYYLARNLLAIFQQDYRLVAKLHVECGWVPAETSIAEFESAMRTLCEPIFERPLADISFGHMLISLFRTAGQFEMPIQPQLVLLQKTLLNIEGLGRQLYPDLNLWDTAKPFLERWLADRYAPQSVLRRLQKEAPFWLETLPRLPDLIIKNLQEVPPQPPKSSAFSIKALVLTAMGLGLVTMGSGALDQPIIFITGAGLLVLASFSHKHR
jgi:ubiquinone biosynthesis protein